MTSKKYGKAPENLGVFNIHSDEMMAYMYAPVKFPGSDIRLEPRMNFIEPLLNAAKKDIKPRHYVYVTIKNLFCTKDNPGNRPGWHSDGFLTDDVNYIWTDKYPTVFCEQDFDIVEDHVVSMDQFRAQVNVSNEKVYPEKSLLRLTDEVIHRSPDISVSSMRCFVKISISDERYNLVGNSHNYLFDYWWKLYERNTVRNHPIYKERDFVV